MSRVYQFEEIGASPEKLGCFEQGIDLAVKGFQGLVNDEYIEGAFLYGSAIFGDANPRSDIDALVVPKQFDNPTLQALKNLFRNVKDRSGVPLGMTAFSVDDLCIGRHTLRDSMLAWLHLQTELFPQYLIGANPLDFITPLEQDLLTDVDLYLTERKQVMTSSYIHGHDVRPEAMLEIALNTPHKCGRKTLISLLHKGLISADVLPDMRKATVNRGVIQLFGIKDPVITDLQLHLMADFSAYTKLVEETKAQRIDSDEYNQLVYATLAVDLPKAIELTRRIQTQFRTYIN
jgi:predicted nucleotidyltransferase